MLRKKAKVCVALIIITLLPVIIFHHMWKPNSRFEIDDVKMYTGYKNIVWFTQRHYAPYLSRGCPQYQCVFSSPEFLPMVKIDAYLFYGASPGIRHLPIPRPPRQIWALLHEESPRHAPKLMRKEILRLFNFTSTFSRYSDKPITLIHLQNVDALITKGLMYSKEAKNEMALRQKLAPVLFLQSDCKTPSKREEYVAELMKYIAVDSYGPCLNNRFQPDRIRYKYPNTLYEPHVLRFIARYKFIIAYENTVCNDYITENFWRPLVVGSIPIYFGSPTIRDWAPNNKSAIYIDDFSSPRQLAQFIKKVDSNDTEYESYLGHKHKKTIDNQFLLQQLKDQDHNAQTFFADFECFVCKQLHTMRREEHYTANERHLDCPRDKQQPRWFREAKRGIYAGKPRIYL